MKSLILCTLHYNCCGEICSTHGSDEKFIQSFSLKACRYRLLADLDVGGKMGVKQGVTIWATFTWLKVGSNTGSFEHGNNFLGCILLWNFLTSWGAISLLWKIEWDVCGRTIEYYTYTCSCARILVSYTTRLFVFHTPTLENPCKSPTRWWNKLLLLFNSCCASISI
jgi:hypothetical protein